MKASVWFEAQGQRMRARGYPWNIAKRLIGLYALPVWAQRAFARGHLNTPIPSPSEEKVEQRGNRGMEVGRG